MAASSRLSVLAGAILAATPAYAAGGGTPLPARLDHAIDAALADKRIVGAVVLVMQDGRTVYRRAAGHADRETKRPMREDSIFRLSSMSKPLVSAAALALVDQGRLGFDDPVTKWLPSFRPKTADGSRPPITVRQLLTHTAGLSYDFLEPAGGPYHEAGVSSGLDQPGLSMDEELRRIASAGLAYEPGQGWGYSVAIDVLGAVVAEVAGAPLPQVVERLVTGPLGMADTGFSVSDPQRLAAPYADGAPEPVRMADPHLMPFAGLAGIRFSPSRVFSRNAFPSGGAGMVGTAPDFIRFLEAVRTGGSPILTRASAASMLTSQTGDLPIATNGPGWGFGFGGAVVTDPEAAETPQARGTWTWGGVYGHSWFVDPQNDLVVVALTNTAIEGMSGDFVRDIRDAVYGK